MKKKEIIVIGAGFAGLAAASLLAKDGHAVTILEKNDQWGGRARIWEKDGFRFDMGPSWYWMPDVFDEYFALFDKKVEDFYDLKRLDPGYRIYFGKNDYIDIPAKIEELKVLFESLETGGANKLEKFLKQAGYKYEVGMKDYVFRPSNSVAEYLNVELLRKGARMQLFTSMSNHIKSFFSNPCLIKILEFPVLFLGATPQNTPALYSLMNYADLVLGTWYPSGGMNEIARAMVAIAQQQGVEICLNTEVKNIRIENGRALGVETSTHYFNADLVISNADYAHTDQTLIASEYRSYTRRYWESRTLAPSCLIFYLGVSKKLKNIQHHNLFFDEDFQLHAEEIYSQPRWPSKPLFYVSCPSKTDSTVAPQGFENLFLLMPIAPGIEDAEEKRELYFDLLLNRFEAITGENIRGDIVVKRSYCLKDFISDYHSFKGNAYGLANTLKQTAFWKPKMRSKKVKNLLYTGQLTVPGPGVPPALISGQVVAREAHKYFTSKNIYK